MSGPAPALDLADDAARAAVVARLAERYAGRPVLVGPGILAGYTQTVAELTSWGCPVLVVSTGRGAGPVPADDTCTVVELTLPPTPSMTEEVRVHDRAVRTLPPEAVAAVEAFDPQRRGVWVVSPFVSDDEPILGRPVLGGRPGAYLALEDKMRADEIWAAADVEHAPYRIVECDAAALAAATAEIGAGPQGARPGGMGVVWSGDARDGVNGGGNFVRWVRDARDQTAAFAFFAPRCDRVRVMPFLDGVPCSIHGFVVPGPGGGTAVFRPVELAILRQVEERRFVYGGLSTWWDPPAADREEMRGVARRVGDHLSAAHDYRGAFGIDGVLTAGGFRPTELNTRMSAGVTTIAAIDPTFFALLQRHLVAGLDTGLSVADLETLLPLMDAHRTGRPSAVGQGVSVGGSFAYPVSYDDGARLERVPERATSSGGELVAADTPFGFFAKIDPCMLLAPGDRLAPLNAALLAHLDATYGTGFGTLVAAPDLRT